MNWIVLLILVPISTAHTDKYKVLPPTYALDDYVTCLKTDGLYCKVDVRLENGTAKNVLWDLIKESIDDKYSFNRNVIHRGICVPKKEAKNLKTITKFSESLLEQKLKGTNLVPHTVDITCDSKDVAFTSFDIIFVFFFVIYISLVLFATIYDVRYKRLKSENHVQTFLLISTWIVTFQTYSFYKSYGRFTAKHVCIVLINRFFRLCVCNTVMMSLMRLSWSKLIPGPITFDSLILFQTSCMQNWWYTFFFINNHSRFITICNPASWYLSVDFQLYTVTVITLYLIFKFKLSEKVVVGSLLLFSYILYGTDIYVNKMDILFRINVKYQLIRFLSSITWLFKLLIFVPLSTAYTDKYQILPPTYELEDYVTCLNGNDTYCKIDVRLKSDSDMNALWKLIQESKNDKYSYDRSIIQRGICVPKKEATSLKTVTKFSHSLLKEKLKGTNLLPQVLETMCDTKDVVLTYFDIMFGVFLVTYLSFIVCATIYDLRQNRINHEHHGNNIILSFSLLSNWERLCMTAGNEEFNKLKSIQGIRFYNMILIIHFHTLSSSSIIYLSNPEEIGKFFLTGAFGTMNYIAVLYSLLVQTFLLISMFIVTFQIYNFYKGHGRFTAKHVCIVLINRFFRLCVCNSIMMSIMRLSLSKLLQGPITFDVFYLCRRSCTENWWYSFFFINNHLFPKSICHPISWYLSVDFQLHIIVVLALYLIFKFKLSEKIVVGSLLLFFCILYGTDIYVNKMDIIFRINTKFCRMYTDLFAFSKLYLSTISNCSTSIVGIGLGFLYTKNKNRRITNNRMVSLIWLLLFFGLPFTVILIAENEFSGISAAVVGPCGILGMSHNIGGIIKRVCENRYVVVMGNFSYSTYSFQTGVIFMKGFASYSLMEFESSQLVKSFLFVDLPLSIIMGVLGALLFEQPGINLQKIILPQLPHGRQQRKKTVN